MKVLVTGAFGNIGTSTCRALRQQGHRVRCFDLKTRANEKSAQVLDPEVEVAWGDLRRPEDVPALAAELYERALERESREVERLEQVLTLVGHAGCQTAALCSHFGETLPEPCGHCTWCRNGGQPVELLEGEPPRIDEDVLERALELRRRESATLAEPRAFARFLAGITSPKLTKKRLSRHDLFGCLNEMPFAELLIQAEKASEP